MLYELLNSLANQFSALNVFQYITLRAICAVLTALAISLTIGPLMIRKLSIYKIGQTVRQDGPPTHFDKVGTPTMGGLLILASVLFATLLWADLSNRFVQVVLFTCCFFGVIGWYDDYQKLVHKDPVGMGSRNKFLSQSVVALIAAVWLYLSAEAPVDTTLIIPLFKDVAIPLGILFLPLCYLVIVGTSNAVNLTDGLDGLAIVPAAMVAGALAVFCYLSMAVTGIYWFSSVFTTIILALFALVLFWLTFKTRFARDALIALGLISVIYILQDITVGPQSDLKAYENVVGILPARGWMYVWFILSLGLLALNLKILFSLKDKEETA